MYAAVCRVMVSTVHQNGSRRYGHSELERTASNCARP